MIGKVWTTTTQDLADRVLKDGKTFTIRTGTGSVTGLQWWMPGILRTLVNHRLAMDEPDTEGSAILSTKRFAAAPSWNPGRIHRPGFIEAKRGTARAFRGPSAALPGEKINQRDDRDQRSGLSSVGSS
jgi:hypothetical protein